MIFWITLRIYNNFVEVDNPIFNKKCFHDYILYWIKGLTIYLSQNLDIRDYLLILSSNSLDFLVLFTFIHFTMYSRSSKLPITVSLFYVIRFITQKFTMLEYYEIYLFDYPNFLSLTVPFGRAPDFFYSGHVGICLIIAYYLYKNDLFFAFCICLLILLLEGFVLVVTRTHYSIDIIFGVIAAHYICLFNTTLIRFIDITWERHFNYDSIGFEKDVKLKSLSNDSYEMKLLA